MASHQCLEGVAEDVYENGRTWVGVNEDRLDDDGKRTDGEWAFQVLSSILSFESDTNGSESLGGGVHAMGSVHWHHLASKVAHGHQG